MHARINILGVPVDAVTRSDAVRRIRELAQDPVRQHLVTTPNPEMIVAAQKDADFLKILNSATLALPDGAGILWAAKRLGLVLPERVTGVDTVEAVCSMQHGESVFLLGAAPGIPEKAAAVLQQKNSSLEIAGTFSGSPLEKDDEEARGRINASGAKILLVAYGAPAQEQWIARNLQYLDTVRVAMGVGGAFDCIAGHVMRAPPVFRRMHIEWLWRFILQPWRIKRIITATVVFPWMILFRR